MPSSWLYPFATNLALFLVISESEDAQEGGWIVLPNKSDNKNTQGFYTGSVQLLTYVQFSITQIEFHYPQVLQTGSPGTFTTASFSTGSLATLQPQVLHQVHLQPYRLTPPYNL